MGFDNIFRNRINLPVARPMLAQGGEQTIVWSADPSGLLKRLEEAERYIGQLESRIANLEHLAASRSMDLQPGPVDATTFYEMASDGTLRAGINVSVPAGGLFEIALFPEPTVKLATADAEVREDMPNTNYGSGNSLAAFNGAAGSTRRALLKIAADNYPDGYWDMPVIALLRLRLYGTPNEQTVYCRAVTGDWAEGTVTWNNQPEAEGQVLDSEFVEATDTYSWFDVKPFLHRLRRRYDENNALAFFGFRIEPDESKQEGAVTWYSREGAPDDDSKPQLLYWFAPETSKICQGGTKENRLYGKPGGTYWFAYRMMDANNNPSNWSMPVRVDQLPSQGAEPAAPDTPVLEPTSIRNMKIIYIGGAVPVDFDYYQIRINTGSTDKYFKSRSDRFLYTFLRSSYEGDQTFRVYARVVTRSGKTSPWSGYATFTAVGDGRYYCEDGPSNSTGGFLEIRPGGSIVAHHPQGGCLYERISGDYYRVLKDDDKDIEMNNIKANVVMRSSDTQASTTSQNYVTRDSFQLTPPGSGTALVLLLARATVFRNTADAIRLTFKVDNEYTNAEEAYSASAQAETVTIARVVQVTAGTYHDFYFCFKSGNGGQVIIYRSFFCAIDLGRL